MSHELRTPLNAIIGVSEMLREDAEAANQDLEPLDRVLGAGRHHAHSLPQHPGKQTPWRRADGSLECHEPTWPYVSMPSMKGKTTRPQV
jgi:hypothetical protein